MGQAGMKGSELVFTSMFALQIRVSAMVLSCKVVENINYYFLYFYNKQQGVLDGFFFLRRSKFDSLIRRDFSETTKRTT